MRFGQYVHPLVMFGIFTLIWRLTGSSGLFITMCGIELVSIHLHQHEHHTTEGFFTSSWPRYLGASLAVFGLVLCASGYLSIPALAISLVLMATTQAFSLGWRGLRHEHDRRLHHATIMVAASVVSFICTLVLHLLYRS